MIDSNDRDAEVLEVHEVVFIDHEVGYECGCNEHGDGHPDGLPFLTDALKHQVRALHAAGLLVTPAHDAAVAARALREAADALDELQTPANEHPAQRDPALWLHERADRIEREGGSDV